MSEAQHFYIYRTSDVKGLKGPPIPNARGGDEVVGLGVDGELVREWYVFLDGWKDLLDIAKSSGCGEIVVSVNPAWPHHGPGPAIEIYDSYRE